MSDHDDFLFYLHINQTQDKRSHGLGFPIIIKGLKKIAHNQLFNKFISPISNPKLVINQERSKKVGVSLNRMKKKLI